ncbi:MAG TPA: homoserine O-acetyltransferase [Flavisolibacter sp.]|nr:homoserine O-acetyltransferase [Flavisolibacter sp.]
MSSVFAYNQSFTLESGQTLSSFKLTYTSLGTLNARSDNVVWIFHALTANSDPSEWWYGLVGSKKLFDPAYYNIICVNMPGSCYGSIGPLEENPETGEPYYHDFPMFTTRDMIRAYQHLRKYLGIQKIHIGIGGSMGGQQLMEWAIEEPDLFEYIFPIATNAKHSPWGIAFNSTQRFCIESDPTWMKKSEIAGIAGMKIARAIALLSYRHYNTYLTNQMGLSTETIHNTIDKQLFRAETYQKYQGEKLAKRFNAFSYYFLSKSMDLHDISRGRGTMENTLQIVKAKTLVIGIKTDILFPIEEQAFLAKHIPQAEYIVIDSSLGHDGFLLEFEQIGKLIMNFLIKVTQPLLIH